MMASSTHKALHTGEMSSPLPDADNILSSENVVSRSDANSKRTMPRTGHIVRRNPYGSSSFGHNASSTFPPQSNFVDSGKHGVVGNDDKLIDDERRTKDFLRNVSIVENSERKNGKHVAYNSYRYGTKSISRSRLGGLAEKESSSGLRPAKQVLLGSSQPMGPNTFSIQSLLMSLLSRGNKLLEDLNGSSELSVRYQQRMILIPFLVVVCLSIPSILEPLTRTPEWKWSPDRRLDDRQCVMNLFIEKQPLDEYNPDFIEPTEEQKKSGKEFNQPEPVKVDGTYRTKGQMKVVTRLIESVADSFRSNTTVQQHLVFTGTRDGGHLAEIALKHWPPRGSFRTQLHLIAADHEDPDVSSEHKSNLDNGGGHLIASEDALMYGYLEAIEDRFKGKDQVRIYDRSGVAGEVGVNNDDDDETEELPWRRLQAVDEIEDDDIEKFEEGNAIEIGSSTDLGAYPSLESLIKSSEDGDDGEIGVIPYMHIDGKRMKDQMEILESSRKLFEDEIVVVAGIEHSPDMDVYKLIEHFNSVNYKTFFLGSRQIARIDNLCPEILDDIIRHPFITSMKLRKLGRWLKLLGLPALGADKEEMKKNPPFFVAMPRGRLNREEMTIQHMYDLFGGYGGGGGQIKTANDRKAPGK